jgi:hypothetical protein
MNFRPRSWKEEIFIMKIREFATKVTVVAAMAILSIPAQASHSWSVYHWARQANPFTLKVTDNMTQEWQTAFDGSIAEWDTPLGSNLDALDFSVLQGAEDKKTRRRCNPKGGQINVCNLSYGNTGWLGIASININSAGHITKGSAKMNDFYSTYWAIPGERNHVTCQEIGHLFGLGHQSEDFDNSLGTCMDYSSDIASEWPNLHDFEELQKIYLHLDSYDTFDGDSGDDSGDSGTCNAPPNKGCNKAGLPADIPMGVPAHVGLNHEIWVASDGRGGYWIHHIRLVPDAYRHP